jgi:hypothetical protein
MWLSSDTRISSLKTNRIKSWVSIIKQPDVVKLEKKFNKTKKTLELNQVNPLTSRSWTKDWDNSMERKVKKKKAQKPILN